MKSIEIANSLVRNINQSIEVAIGRKLDAKDAQVSEAINGFVGTIILPFIKGEDCVSIAGVSIAEYELDAAFAALVLPCDVKLLPERNSVSIKPVIEDEPEALISYPVLSRTKFRDAQDLIISTVNRKRVGNFSSNLAQASKAISFVSAGNRCYHEAAADCMFVEGALPIPVNIPVFKRGNITVDEVYHDLVRQVIFSFKG